MEAIIKLSSAVDIATTRNDDDFFDRLAHRYTKALLTIFAIVLTTNQLVGDLINCWVPAHFSKNWITYTNSYCWVKNTYYLPFHEYIPKEQEPGKRLMIPYYQWVPIILLVMALFFQFPLMVWRSFSAQSGVDLANIVESSETFQDTKNIEAAKKTLKYITQQVDRYLTSHKNYNPSRTLSLKCLLSFLCVCCGRRFGNYLTTLYIFTKGFYFATCVTLLLLLNIFMGQDYTSYGVEAMRSLGSQESWPQSARFPRVTMCDFKVRFIGNVQRYTVQCVLPINLFNEKVFLFLWVWIFFVMIATFIGAMVWVIRALLRADRVDYIRNHLKFKGDLDRDLNTAIIEEFTHEYLQQDGVFMLRLIGHNTNAITVTEITCSLFKKFQENRRVVEMSEIEPNGKYKGGYYA